MASRTLVGGLSLKGDWDLGEDNWKAEFDLNLLKLSVLVHGSAESLVAAEPGAPAEGEIVILGDTHATHPNAIAAFDEGAWVYIDPWDGLILWLDATEGYYSFTAADGWSPLATGGGGGGWTDVEFYDHAVDGNSTGIIADVSAFDEVLILVDGVSLAASAWRVFQVSTDGGATYYTASGNYKSLSGAGGLTNENAFYPHSTNASAARTCSGHFPITHIRVVGFNAGVLSNIIGGKITIRGR